MSEKPTSAVETPALAITSRKLSSSADSSPSSRASEPS